MGNWKIEIEGMGVHHNTTINLAEDANRMAAEFVKLLKERGHQVTAATIMIPYRTDDLTNPGYLESLKRSEG